jgi:hypothetical protein
MIWHRAREKLQAAVPRLPILWGFAGIHVHAVTAGRLPGKHGGCVASGL